MDGDLLSYRLEKRFSSELLNSEIIQNNLYEADRIHNTTYIMSVGISWLRANPGKTMRDLELKFEELRIQTIIVSLPHRDDTVSDLCIPGNPDAVLKWSVAFIHDMRRSKHEFLDRYYNVTYEENLELLRETGFSCPLGQAYDVASVKHANILMLRKSPVTTQLQWASICIEVELFDTEQKYADELRMLTDKYGKEPYKYKVNIEGIDIDFLVMPKDGAVHILSEFGVAHRGRPTAIHIDTFVAKVIKDKLSCDDAEAASEAEAAIAKALDKFNPRRLINAPTADQDAIMHYIEQNKRKFLANTLATITTSSTTTSTTSTSVINPAVATNTKRPISIKPKKKSVLTTDDIDRKMEELSSKRAEKMKS